MQLSFSLLGLIIVSCNAGGKQSRFVVDFDDESSPTPSPAQPNRDVVIKVAADAFESLLKGKSFCWREAYEEVSAKFQTIVHITKIVLASSATKNATNLIP